MKLSDEVTREVLDRLITIESTLKSLVQEHPAFKEQVNNHSVAIARIEGSTDSAHKRIDDMSDRIYKVVGIASTLVGVFASLLTWALSR